MASTKLYKTGVNTTRLTDKQRHFVLEYLVDHNGARAAIAAGYSEKGAAVAANKLMRNPLVKRLIGKLQRETQEKFQIEREEILKHLAACAMRDGKDFVNEDGMLIVDRINDLPDRVTCAIDSIKQRVRRYTGEDGIEVVEVETDLKLASKLGAIEMAMRHKGLFAAEQVEHRVTVDWDGLIEQSGNGELPDPIEGKILSVEKKALPEK